jgi:hypothetical protein
MPASRQRSSAFAARATIGTRGVHLSASSARIDRDEAPVQAGDERLFLRGEAVGEQESERVACRRHRPARRRDLVERAAPA